MTMHDHPTPLELIRIANETLVSEVLPHARAEQLYPLRMIANALGIAARELESSDRNAALETSGLDTLYSDAQPPHALHARNGQFAQDIRGGRFESNATQATALRQHLLATARAKLSAAYPKGLSNPTSDIK